MIVSFPVSEKIECPAGPSLMGYSVEYDSERGMKPVRSEWLRANEETNISKGRSALSEKDTHRYIKSALVSSPKW